MSSARVTADAPVTFTRRQIAVIMVGLMLGMSLAAFDQMILGPAIPKISSDLPGALDISWIVSAYLLTTTAVTPIYGKLSDLYGRRALFQVGISIFVLSSALCALATTIDVLVAARALQGVGGGGLIVLAQATVADVVSPRERGRYQAYFATVWILASGLGPIFGGAFADYLSWRWVFWINVPLGIVALLVSRATLKGLVRKGLRHKIDYLGAILLVTATCCLLLVTTLGGNGMPWDAPAMLELMGAALVLFGLAVVQERRAIEPILPPRLFRNQSYVLGNITSATYSATMLGAITFVPTFFQMVYGFGPSDSGFISAPMFIAMPISNVIGGRITAATGRYKIFPVVGLALATVSMALMALGTPSTPLAVAMIESIFCGVGIGLVGPMLLLGIQNAVDPRDIGAATGSFAFFRNLGGSFGVTLFGTILISCMDRALHSLPEAAGIDNGAALLNAGADALRQVPAALRGPVAEGISGAYNIMFICGAVGTGIAFLSVLFMRELPLKTITGAAERAAAEKPR